MELFWKTGAGEIKAKIISISVNFKSLLTVLTFNKQKIKLEKLSVFLVNNKKDGSYKVCPQRPNVIHWNTSWILQLKQDCIAECREIMV